MIEFKDLNQETPYLKLKEKYDSAKAADQKIIQAISISSYSNELKEVNSRFVNLKFIDNKEFIFFSNYDSPKSQEFKGHNQITALIYWNSINVQIRLKAIIKKTSLKFNKDYFLNRSKEKNALAISSNQSMPIDSYESIKNKYAKTLELNNLKECPEFWGGYSFIPYYFEFWEGHDARINKRESHLYKDNKWIKFFLQP